jgi:hypothetical protein
MSRQIARDAIHLRPTPRIAHTEYSVGHYHSGIIEASIGKRTGTAADGQRFNDAWDIDFLFGVHDGPVGWGQRGRVSDMGHADYAENGSDRRETMSCPFEAAAQVLEFDAVKEYGLPDFAELVKCYEDHYQATEAANPGQLYTGGYYKTVISGAIQAFGWDMLLTAAADKARFARVLQSFGALTLHHVKAWAETSIEVFIQHDDFVWTEGPFMDPVFYRQVIIPLYRQCWDVLHRAGKKVIFCSDGTFTMFMDDLAKAGAEGFIFEPTNDFAWVVQNFGRTHCLVGSAVDCRTMTFNGWEAVKREIDATLALAPQCAGLIWAVGNHMPANIPTEIGMCYIQYLKSHWKR